MDTNLNFDINRQPDETTCGPTCLHALYRFYGDPIALVEVIDQVPQWQKGGTLDVYLAMYAMTRGYQTTILPFNLTVFDPTWAGMPPTMLADRLRKQLRHKKDLPGFEEVTQAYLDYLAPGGKIRYSVITPMLIRKYLKAGIPILAGLSATYLYNQSRELERDGRVIYDDIRGVSCGHFVILGALCTPHDVWGFSFLGTDIQEKDVLMIPTQGAYTYSLRQHFIKALPKVVVHENGRFFLATDGTDIHEHEGRMA